jgi:hypothetical protein
MKPWLFSAELGILRPSFRGVGWDLGKYLFKQEGQIDL